MPSECAFFKSVCLLCMKDTKEKRLSLFYTRLFPSVSYVLTIVCLDFKRNENKTMRSCNFKF